MKSMPTLADLRALPMEGAFVRLEPLTLAHAPELFEIGKDPATWEFLEDEPLTSMGKVLDRIHTELESALPFAIRMRESDEFAGCIEYRSIDPHNESIELGWMWLGRPYSGTLAAPEAMQLLAAHAFDGHGAGRVWMTTDARNKASNASLRSFGITFEVCLRRNLRLSDGLIRDTNVYSITIDEWPELKKKWERFVEFCVSSGERRPRRRASVAKLFRPDAGR